MLGTLEVRLSYMEVYMSSDERVTASVASSSTRASSPATLPFLTSLSESDRNSRVSSPDMADAVMVSSAYQWMRLNSILVGAAVIPYGYPVVHYSKVERTFWCCPQSGFSRSIACEVDSVPDVEKTRICRVPASFMNHSLPPWNDMPLGWNGSVKSLDDCLSPVVLYARTVAESNDMNQKVLLPYATSSNSKSSNAVNCRLRW